MSALRSEDGVHGTGAADAEREAAAPEVVVFTHRVLFTKTRELPLKMEILIGFLTIVSVSATTLMLLNARDDRFRNHCVDVKRIYDDGNCLGFAAERKEEPKSRAKLGGEKSYNDLAGACAEAGGWLESSSSNKGPKCGGISKDPTSDVP